MRNNNSTNNSHYLTLTNDIHVARSKYFQKNLLTAKSKEESSDLPVGMPQDRIRG